MAQRVPWMRAAAYAIGDAGFNLYWVCAESFLLFFYTDVAQLSPAHVAFVLLLGRLVDFVAGPMVGIAADHTRTRVGSYRPYLLCLALPLGVSAILLFTKPSLWPIGFARAPGGAFTLTAVSSALFALCYSAANVPYTALLSVVTSDPAERTRFASLRFAFAMGAGLFVQYGTLTLVARLGISSAASGWQRTLLLYSLPASAALVICGLCTRERPSAPIAEVKVSFAVSNLFQSSTWWWCVLAMASSIAAFSCRAAASPFYLKYFISPARDGGLFLTVNSAGALISCLLVSGWPQIIRPQTRLGLACASAGALVTCGLLFVSPDRWSWQLLVQMAFGLATGALVPTIFSIFSDLPQSVGQLSEINVIGIIAASSLLSIKAGAMLGVALVSLALWIIRYQPAAVSTTDTLTTIRCLMSLAPAILLLISAIALIRVERSLDQSAAVDAASPAALESEN